MKFSQQEIAALREDNALAARLIERCVTRAARISVIGFDIDAHKAAAIASGKSYLLHIPDGAVAAARGRGLVRA